MSERKSASAYRTISEVAESLGVPQHVLRFWETKFPAVKPLKRGGNRRYYRPEDIELLQVIHKLLHVDGYTIKGAQKLLKERGVRALVEEFLSGEAASPAAATAEAVAEIEAEAAAEVEVGTALAEAGIPEALTVEPDGVHAPALVEEAAPAQAPALAAASVEAVPPTFAPEAQEAGNIASAVPSVNATQAPAPSATPALLVSELKSIRARLAEALGAAAV